MKKLIFLIFVLCSAKTFSGQLPKMIDNGLEYSGFYDMSYYNGNVSVLARYKFFDEFTQAVVISNIDGEWKELPLEVKSGDITGYLMISGTQSTINYDSSGGLWVSGYSLYNFSDGKWREIFIDDSFRAIRSYRQMCIDKFNNLWATTRIYNSETKEQYSELLRFNGVSFETVLKFNMAESFVRVGGDDFYSYSMSALPDGRIALLRTMSQLDEDVLNGVFDNFYIINQDLSYEKQILQTDSGPQAKIHNKNVSQILSDDAVNIWLAMGSYFYYDSQQMNKSCRCCSGLSLLRDDKWKLFNESDGLVRGRDSTTEPINRIIRLDDERLFAIGRKRVYNIDRNNKLIELNWEDILSGSEFILSHPYYQTDKGIASLTKAFESFDDEEIVSACNKMRLIDHGDGNFWMLMNSGILIMPKSVVTVVEENKGNEQALLYPNPAGDIININSAGMEYSYSIFNIMGEKLISGSSSVSEISISSLPVGSYYIRLQFNAGESKTINFIKSDN